MDPEKTVAAMTSEKEQLEREIDQLVSKNEQLKQENDQLKTTVSVVMENLELRTLMHSFCNGTSQDVSGSALGRPSSRLWQNTFDEPQFRKDLRQTGLQHAHRTSSPVDFKSFIQSSLHVDTRESQSCQDDVPPEVSGPNRLLGEIAYQLDKRILSHVFQGHKRLYGFTLLNIPDKIIEVSTHPLTGKVDEGYRLHLTQRYAGLMEDLSQLGFKAALHSPFIEFVVNTYGILKEKSGERSGTQAMDSSNPDFLRRLIMTSAPRKLQKNLLLLLTCLCRMAERDRKPLFLW